MIRGNISFFADVQKLLFQTVVSKLLFQTFVSLERSRWRDTLKLVSDVVF